MVRYVLSVDIVTVTDANGDFLDLTDHGHGGVIQQNLFHTSDTRLCPRLRTQEPDLYPTLSPIHGTEDPSTTNINTPQPYVWILKSTQIFWKCSNEDFQLIVCLL